MRSYLQGLIGFVLAVLATAGAAEAQCVITGVQSITGLSANFGTYTTAAGATASMTITVTVTKTGTGNCANLHLTFQGATVPAGMTGPGTPKLLYDLVNQANRTVIFAGAPARSVLLNTPSRQQTDGMSSFSMTVTVAGTAASGQSTVPNGPYLDTSLSAIVWNNALTAQIGSRPVTVSASVANPRSCTIGGSATPSAGSATIPITATGRVSSVAPITPTLPLGTAVSCSGVGAVTIGLSSLNGKLTGPANTNSAFANTIDYTASANVAGGTAATYTSTSGAATTGITGGTSGNLVVSVTPVDPGKPLIAGSYSDTLTIRILPQ